VRRRTASVGVAGTTSWGTTLAILLAREGTRVRLWARTEDEAEALRASGRNERFVPGVEFPPGLLVTASPEEAFGGADIAIFAVPSSTLRENARAVRDWLQPSTVVLSATKGLELRTGKRMSQVLGEELPPWLGPQICALSGPNLAREIVQGKPSSTVVASPTLETAEKAQRIMNSSVFRVYTNEDLIGVEFGGALKNVIAIGAGICDGLGLGDNAKAAFVTRGLAEITRLGAAAGADPLTFAGLAGMGDLVATCYSTLSRNYTVGRELAEGKPLSEIRASMENVAEGVDTTAAAVDLAAELKVEMPIASATYDVLFSGLRLQDAMAELMRRAPSLERAGIRG